MLKTSPVACWRGRQKASKIQNEIMGAYLDLGGTIRSCTTEKTLQIITPLLNKIGLTRIADVTGLDNIGVPVALAIRPNAKHLSVAMGKGMTWELAKISAFMEALEVYHIENPQPSSLQGTYQELRNGWPVISPQEFSTGFFSVRSLEKIPLKWTHATEVITQKRVFIPHALINMNSTKIKPDCGLFQVSTNGLAAGNTENEALCHGLFEVIERDSLFRWSQLSVEERKKTRIRLDTIDSLLNLTLIEKYRQSGIKVKVWDITSEINIPSFHCVIYDPNPFRIQGLFRGTGTHLSKDIALVRALTEAAQSRLGMIAGSRDDIFPDQYKQYFHYVEEAKTEERDFVECISYVLPSLFEDIAANIIARLHRLGFQRLYQVTHTKTDIGVPVIQIFVPGMHFHGVRA